MNVEVENKQPDIQRPWEDSLTLPFKPDFAPCGFIREGIPTACEQEDLLSSFREQPYEFLWIPQNERLIRPENAPELLEIYRGFAAKAARGTLIWGLLLTIGSVLLFIAFQDWRFIYRNLLFVLGFGLLALGLWDYHKVRNFAQQDAVQMADEARFSYWLEEIQLPTFTFTNIIAGVFALVLIGQYLLGGNDKLGLQAAALVKPLVLKGEVWRLLTATVMHGSIIHCWMNTMAWLDFGRRCETLANRTYVPLVFVVSAFCGSVLSVVFYPNTISVGASGGILGLLGFLLVASWRRPDAFPRSFVRSSMRNIVWIGVLGLAGFAFIDNAAHLGGLIGGAGLAWILIDPQGREFPLPVSSLTRRLGWAALLIVICIAGVAVWQIWRS